jgi:hypothetical protein
MKLVFNRNVQKDVTAILAYYDEAGGSKLGDTFFAELMAHVKMAKADPTRFHPVSNELRRVNLSRFPYHFLFRLKANTVRVLVVRCHTRHPSFGLTRK